MHYIFRGIKFNLSFVYLFMSELNFADTIAGGTEPGDEALEATIEFIPKVFSSTSIALLSDSLTRDELAGVCRQFPRGIVSLCRSALSWKHSFL